MGWGSPYLIGWGGLRPCGGVLSPIGDIGVGVTLRGEGGMKPYGGVLSSIGGIGGGVP